MGKFVRAHLALLITSICLLLIGLAALARAVTIPTSAPPSSKARLHSSSVSSAQLSSGSPTPVHIAISQTPLTTPRPTNFLGLALENNTIPEWVGHVSSARQVDPTLVGLIQTLDPNGNPVIRIGGQSSDRSWWPVPGMAQPLGVTQALTPDWAQDARSLAQALRARLIIGINFEANSLEISQYEADELVKRIPAPYLAVLEIGNEPSQYTQVPWYERLDGKIYPWYEPQVGRSVFSRPPGYDEVDFLPEFRNTLSVLPAQVAIAGPDALSTSWLAPFSQQFVSPGGRVKILDSHAYALSSCSTNPDSIEYPSISHLLAISAWRDILNGALPAIALSHRDGLQYRIDELGSVTCNGQPGVSNTMASALWVSNALMYAARQGVDGVNLHSYPHSSNGLFDISHGSTGWSAQLHPLFDGVAMFSRADPAGARELSLTSAGPATLQTWATIGADNQVRVLVVNTGPRRRVTIQAPIGFGAKPGSLQRLLAPSVSATRGLTLGGRPVGITTTGKLPTPKPDLVQPITGAYTLTAAADSETLLTLPGR